MHLDASLDSLEEPATTSARGAGVPIAPPPTRTKAKTNAPLPNAGRRPVPPPFSEDATRQVTDQLLASLREQPKATGKPSLPKPSTVGKNHFDEPTRMANIDPRAFDDVEQANLTVPDRGHLAALVDEHEESTRMANIDSLSAIERTRKPGSAAGGKAPPRPGAPGPKSASRAAAKAPSSKAPNDERTRAVDIRNDPSISDIDWDLD